MKERDESKESRAPKGSREPRDRERTTFLEVGQIVERTKRYARRARDLLIVRMQREAPDDERTRLSLEMLERQRAELEADLERATEGLSRDLLRTRIQYSVDPWDRDPEPPACTTIDEAIHWMLRLDEKLIETYREIAERSDNEDEAQAFFGSLADLICGFDRRLSREVWNSHDV